MSCADDLTAVDLSTVQAGQSHLASTAASSQSSLFPFISFPHSSALNVDLSGLPPSDQPLKRVLRPLDSRDTVKGNDELVGTADEAAGDGGVWSGGALDSQDGDDELLVHVTFSELVRIKSILIGTGGGRLPTSPRLCRAWVNRGPQGVTFDEAGSLQPAQEFELLEGEGGGRGAVEYPVRIAKFANVSDVTLYFGNARGDQSRLYFLGFLGESRQLKKEPGEPMTIGAENAAQHMIDGVKEEKRGASTTSAR
ncbi:hypothetical protein JCM10207_008384 [Rhodosporidiobolus poonsookiae]